MSAANNTAVIDLSTGVCDVTYGTMGRRVRTHLQPFLLAMLEGEYGRIGNAAATAGLRWVDMLATHGVAIGTRGDSTITVAVLPPKARTVRDGDGDDITITFPHLFLVMHTKPTRFVKAKLFCINEAALATIAVTADTACLSSFPWGNVYQTSGNICWGSVRHADIRTLADFEAAFFGSGFNHDLWHGPSGASLTSLTSMNGNRLPPPTTWPSTIVAAIAGVLERNSD